MTGPCGCSGKSVEHSYEDGPTACIASPKVVADIRKQVARGSVLSVADARLASLAGLLDIPTIQRTGFNDGVIYPPSETDAIASAEGLRLSRGLSMAPAAPTTTTLKCLVLCVDFSDNVGTKPAAHFQNLLFDPNNANSMHSFYKDMSYGQLNVTGVVTPWIRAQHPYSYYTNNASGTGNTFPQNTPGLLREILQKYCQTQSLAPFDVNGDGYVDGLFLVHAGGGAEAESNTAKRRNMIWSHKWVLPTLFVNNGVKAFAYFTAPEDGKLGVFSHEFGHFLGLPDLYDTSYRSFGIGKWCLMAGGSWNGQGNQPARLSAWCLATLGWIKPHNVKSAKTLTLPALDGNSTACYRLWTKGKASKEYFLVENRQKAGRDKALPGSGLMLWHVDETQSDNTNPNAYRVALVQADGLRQLEKSTNQGDRGDPFPGSKKVTKVNDSAPGHPHTRDNTGAATGVGLSQIAVKSGVATVKVKV